MVGTQVNKSRDILAAQTVLFHLQLETHRFCSAYAFSKGIFRIINATESVQTLEIFPKIAIKLLNSE